MIGIYIIKNKLNNKIYIGSSLNIEKRWKDHKYYLNNNKHHSILLQRSWALHGEEQFEFCILEVIEHQKDLLLREQYYLDLYKSFLPENGYNVCPTANSMLGYKYSDEQRKWMSENRKGEKNQHYGKKHSEETKKLIGQKNKNRHISDEEKKKKSISMKLTMQRIKEEDPEKFARMTAFKNFQKGKIKSEQTKKKISDAAKKRTGINSTNHKLNYELAELIRNEYKSGNYTYTSLAKKYNCSDVTIREIILNKRWIK